MWHLTSHLHTAHQIAPDIYRQGHGLSRTQPMIAAPVLDRIDAAWQVHAAQHLADLDASRDPARAMEASRGHTGKSVATRVASRHPRGRALTDVGTRLLDAAPDLETWARIARGLLDDGASTTTIGMATGVLRTTVYARVDRLAPRT